ncbi:MAG: hypothetical protein KC457_06410 [Myxococcales bacterium]|nr:hypothetical protein [Myxococcales bacterium]
MRSESASENVSYVYIRLRLDTEELDDLTRTRLGKAGVECLQDGGAYRAYGIIDGDSIEVLDEIAAQPHVTTVELGAPPVGF